MNGDEPTLESECLSGPIPCGRGTAGEGDGCEAAVLEGGGWEDLHTDLFCRCIDVENLFDVMLVSPKVSSDSALRSGDWEFFVI